MHSCFDESDMSVDAAGSDLSVNPDDCGMTRLMVA